MRQAWLVMVSCLLLTSASHPQSSTAGPGATGTAASSAQATPTVSFGGEGLVFSTSDGANQVRVHGYVQGDARLFVSDLTDQSPDRLLFRRVRPLVEGTLFNAMDFRFMPDFGENNAVIQEAYIEVKKTAVLRPRLGKFKTPIGLEALRGDRELTFAERSLVSDLVPIRDLGVQLGGAALGDSVSYAAGYFNGAKDGSNANFEWRNARDLVMRIFFQPFITRSVKPLQHAGIGLAWSTGHQHGPLPLFKTAGQNTFFKYSSTALADGQHQRFAPQSYYFYGPVGVIGEYVVSSQEVRNGMSTGMLSNDAWQFAGSVVLTGERNTYAGVYPNHSFNPTKGLNHLGAWEIAARHSELHADSQSFPVFADPQKAASQADEWAVGMNWYLNRFAKLVVDYEHTKFVMNPLALSQLHAENVVMTRLQLAF